MEFHRNHYELIREAPGKLAWIEVSIILILVIFCCFLARPNDPFFINASTSWSLLAPMLISLRYGFFKGLTAAVALLLAALAWSRLVDTVPPPTIGFSIFTILLVMLAGEFRDVWERRLYRLQESNQYRQLRLDEFTRSYHMLKVSHDRLEQQSVGYSLSLRESLLNLRKSLRWQEKQLERRYHFDPLVASQALRLIADYSSLQQASLYGFQNNKPTDKPLAKLGETVAFNADDPLLSHCLETRQLVSVNPDIQQQLNNQQSDYLACVPFYDANEHLYGVLLVRSMPFFSFQEPVLKLMSVMAGYIADVFSAQSMVKAIDNIEFTDFFINLQRCISNVKHHDLPATLIHFDVERNSLGDQLSDLIQQHRRGLDIVYEQIFDNSRSLSYLLPLTDMSGVDGYRERLQNACKSQLGVSLAQLPVQFHIHNITADPSLLCQFIESHYRNEHILVSYSGNLT